MARIARAPHVYDQATRHLQCDFCAHIFFDKCKVAERLVSSCTLAIVPNLSRAAGHMG